MLLVKCDHCGKEEPRDQDLFTRVNLYNYEASEKDKKDETEVGYDFLDMHLCPECSKEFMKFYVAFGSYFGVKKKDIVEDLMSSDG